MAKVKATTKTKPKTTAVKKAEVKAERLTVPSPEKLLEAGVHFGHLRRRWHPRMAPYIFTEQEGVHVFDLYKTQEALKEATQFIKKTVSDGGSVIFVGTKRQAAEVVEREAKRVGAYFITGRWLGGLLTNFDSVKGNIKKLEDLSQKMKAGELDHYTKKEQLLIAREVEKLEREIGGLRGLTALPKAVVLASAKGEEIAAHEAKLLGIPVVAITDTNADPQLVDYIIPGNDDSATSIELLMATLADAFAAGRKK
ncbi:MAG: 30S ribosomal protein S2 [Patescibacteria group bacterium]